MPSREEAQMKRTVSAPVLVTVLLLSSGWTASCMSTVVRRLECTYDSEAAAATAEGEAGGHRGYVQSIAFTRDGTRIVSSGRGGRVLLWDLKTGASREVVPQRDGPVSLALAENQQALALVEEGRSEIGLFDLRRGEARASIPHSAIGGLRPFVGHAFSRDGALLAIAGEGNRITLWNIKVGQPELELDGVGTSAGDVVFSPDDELLAIAGADGSLQLWSTESGERVDTFEPHGGTPIQALDFSDDGQRIVSAAANGEVAVTSVSGGDVRLVLEECDVGGVAVRSVRYSPSGKAIFGVKRDDCLVQFVCVWDAETGDAVAAFEVPVGDAIDFAADGTMMATGGCGCEIIVWDLESGGPIGQLGASCRLEVEGGCD
jgi:WD40 repeat protein